MLNPVFCHTYYLGYYKHAIKQKNNNRYSVWRHCKKYKMAVWCNVQHVTIMWNSTKVYDSLAGKMSQVYAIVLIFTLTLHDASTHKTLLHIKGTIEMHEWSCCEDWGSHGSEYEDYHLPGMWHHAVYQRFGRTY